MPGLVHFLSHAHLVPPLHGFLSEVCCLSLVDSRGTGRTGGVG